MTETTYQSVTIEVADRIATVTLNRPEVLNAVGAVMHAELRHVFRDLAEREDCDVVVLTGAGRAFCAGGDLAWLQSMIDEPDRFLAILEEAKGIVFSMLELPKPMICRMNGDAIGLGATLALCCDMVVASETARFGDTHVRAGLVAGDGAAVILPYVVGYMRAKEMLLTGALISAQEGREMGLINHVVPAAELDAKVALLAGRLVGGATRAIRYTKIALNKKLRAYAQEQMDMLMAYEALSSRSADHAEAIDAIRSGRKPVFSGR
ncbi:enoyl-CoA hydratase/isomerase family protein [Prosthecomicrobium hirschii]|uniref:enoyl-CoA hydratase/isomerase family protein n=1 Tax=Prosthecodimorpha hirschii TaxID=665126 RepID=UPI00221FCE9A|nr:enoyl-CoA hydratase/isomerase family protein [Prosthecomicrobium hirschii]MCW1842390.1 enoyl-CoA hydratase/isomerase family protein [Prosthecomicrobium hirschii]